MTEYLPICDEQALGLFLGHSVEFEGWTIHPSEPVYVEPERQEEVITVPRGCHYNHYNELVCPRNDLDFAFEQSKCFKVDHQFVCQDDLDHHIRDTGCHVIHGTEICGDNLHSLFRGEHVQLHNGNWVHAEFEGHHDPHYGDQCRMHQGVDFCLENVHDLYEVPHDCVMLAGEWKCQDQMFEAWKSGCIEIEQENVCGEEMVDIVLQGCIDLHDNWVCPTAVGTKHGGYTHDGYHH